MPIQRANRWQVNIRFGPKFLRPTFPTEAEAIAWEDAARVARDRGLPPPPVISDKDAQATLEVFIRNNFQKLWGSNKSSKHYIHYTDELMGFFGKDALLSSITTKEVDRFTNHCEKAKGNSGKTVNRKIAVLSKLLKEAHRQELIDKLPAFRRNPEGKGRKRYLSKEEERQIISTLWSLGHEQAAMRCQFMIYTGARDGEVRSLTWEDVRGRDVTLEGKTGIRTITVPSKAVEALDWAAEKGYVKPFPMAYETFKQQWDAMSAAIGKASEKDWVPYVMRHTCASRLAMAGVDLRRIQKWMGHTSPVTTDIYAHLAPEAMTDCAEALNA